MKVVVTAPHDGTRADENSDQNTGRMARFVSEALYGKDLSVVITDQRVKDVVDVNRPGTTPKSKQVYQTYVNDINSVREKIGGLHDKILLVELHGKKATSGKQYYIEIAADGLKKSDELKFKGLLEQAVRISKDYMFARGERVGWIDEKAVGDLDIELRAHETREKGSFAEPFVVEGLHIEMSPSLRIYPGNTSLLPLEGKCFHRALTAALAVYTGIEPKGEAVRVIWEKLRHYKPPLQ